MSPIRSEFGRWSHHRSHHEFSPFFSRTARSAAGAAGNGARAPASRPVNVSGGLRAVRTTETLCARCFDFAAERYFIARFHGQPTNRNYYS